jgi:hypothetical protein
MTSTRTPRAGLLCVVEVLCPIVLDNRGQRRRPHARRSGHRYVTPMDSEEARKRVSLALDAPTP